MMKLLQSILAGVLSIATLFGQTVPASLGAVQDAFAQGTGSAVQSGLVTGGFYDLSSPALLGAQLWLSGWASQSELGSPSTIYSQEFGDAGTVYVPAVSLPDYSVSDPSVILDPSAAFDPDASASLLMYYTEISAADAASTTAKSLDNHIGFAISADGGATWADQGVVIGQNNGIDDRGGWAPSAFAAPGGEIWLYYSTNGPGAINIYRTRIDGTTHQVLGTDVTYLDDGAETPLEGFNVDVSLDGGQYTMLLNKDFSGIYRYVSDDGIHWRTEQGDVNPIITAGPGALIAAPTEQATSQSVDDGDNSQSVVTGEDIYFSGGSAANETFDSVQALDADLSGQGVFDYSAPSAQNSQTSSETSDNSSSSSPSSSSGSALGIGVGLLGIAGVLGLSYLLGGATVTGAVAAAGAAGAGAAGAGAAGTAKGLSFGGRVTILTPCISVLGPSIWVTIIPAGGDPNPLYIWTPATITYSVGPPVHPGQEILGVADIPFACITPTIPPVPLVGERMQIVGTSP